MKFGGHETFAIREGWLHKGLKLLREDPRKLLDDNAGDWLGVGRNMAKSIRHWLVATQLATVTRQGRKPTGMELTRLGELVWAKDRYFLTTGTWWVLHTNLVASTEYATCWGWFFNRFGLSRFERQVCVEALHSNLRVQGGRLPSRKTLQRDVACLLSSYSTAVPPEIRDPEDGRECPFAELGLVSFFRSSGYYQLNQGPKDVPPEVVAYIVASLPQFAGVSKGTLDLPLLRASREPCSPGRVLLLPSEELYECVLGFDHRESQVEISGLAGERVIRVPAQEPLAWLGSYYYRVTSEDQSSAA